MQASTILIIVAAYFCLLLLISYFTGRNADNSSFFVGNRKSPWFVVAFGMIGASLSGVTFISIPGAVAAKEFSYMQVVFGYMLGYIAVANILLPLYYKLNLTSIYTYLETRFGKFSYKTGAALFLLSRVLGASMRLFLVASVLDKFVLSHYGIPFWATVATTIVLIWLYSFKAGIKTIIWTDTLQTFFMLAAVIMASIILVKQLDWDWNSMLTGLSDARYTKIFVWDWNAEHHFVKDFISGALITIVMTGLDQDMMQKNLSCKNVGDAKKNMLWMSSSLIVINFIFLSLGALLYIFAHQNGILAEQFVNDKLTLILNSDNSVLAADHLFPHLAFNYLPIFVGIVFILGLIAAAYSSADSALTSLTTSFCIDFLGFKKQGERIKTRYLVHVVFSVLILFIILAVKKLNNDSIIYDLFTVAAYTYGPLLGFYAFGLFTKLKIKDWVAPVAGILPPILSFILDYNSEAWFNGYKFGFLILLVNGLITIFILYLSSLKWKK